MGIGKGELPEPAESAAGPSKGSENGSLPLPPTAAFPAPDPGEEEQLPAESPRNSPLWVARLRKRLHQD